MATVVLVHGAWSNPTDWDDVVAGLAAQGIHAETVDLPSSQSPAADLAADELEVRRILDTVSGSKVLVGWSYGGMVISVAATGRDDVEHLVYVAAMMPEEGQTAWDITSSAPSVIGGEGFLTLHDEGTTSITSWPDPQAAQLYGPEVEAIMAERPRRRQAIASSFAPAGEVAWRTTPSTYVVTTRDRAIDPDLQRRMAARAGAVAELDSNHFPMWEATDELVGLIASVARGG